MATKNNGSTAEIFEQWKQEDRSVEKAADCVMDWMRQVEQFGKPHFGETASKLRPFRELLRKHFDREDRMLDELATYYDEDSAEIAAIRRQSARDHTRLLEDLDDFIQRLNLLNPPFDSWQAAMREFDLFFDRLEQHEDQESESMNALMPRE